MTQEPSSPAIRVSAIPFPQRYELPPRPPPAFGAVAQDAYRQARFLLTTDLELFERAMSLQLRIVADSAPSKYRTYPYAALVGLWSRAFQYLADAGALALRGAYVSALPLVRTACETIAAQSQLAAEEIEQFTRWVTQGIRQNRQFAATEIALGRYRAGSTLASHPRLGPIYRVASDLCLSHFGATAIQVAPESNLQRLVILFADNAFHLGWAELVLGWLLELAEAQLGVVVSQPNIFAISNETHEGYTRIAQEIHAALGNPLRCRVEEAVDTDGDRRYLFHNFRRQAGAAPRRILL